MKGKKTPAQRLAGTEIVEMALEIERIRIEDPERYERIMSRLAELEKIRATV